MICRNAGFCIASAGRSSFFLTGPCTRSRTGMGVPGRKGVRVTPVVFAPDATLRIAGLRCEINNDMREGRGPLPNRELISRRMSRTG